MGADRYPSMRPTTMEEVRKYHIVGKVTDVNRENSIWMRDALDITLARIKQLEDGSCRFNCRTGKTNFARGCEWALGFLPDGWEKVYQELKEREKDGRS